MTIVTRIRSTPIIEPNCVLTASTNATPGAVNRTDRIVYRGAVVSDHGRAAALFRSIEDIDGPGNCGAVGGLVKRPEAAKKNRQQNERFHRR